MLSHSLILLCLGVYASCMPLQPQNSCTHVTEAVQNQSDDDTQTGLKEVRAFLGQVRNKTDWLRSMGKVSGPGKPVIPCADFNFRIFITSLESLSGRSPPEGYQSMLCGLRILHEKFAYLQKVPDCSAESMDTSELLSALDMFLRQLFTYVKSKANQSV